MARSLWSGSVSFGLVNVPVKAFTATRDHEVRFHQLEKGTGARIRYRKVSAESGLEVEKDDIESGYEISSGRYVTVSPDEMDSLRPQSTNTIEVDQFVALDEIDPVFFEKTYWLAPDGPAAAKAYQLLLAAMTDQQRVGIGYVVMRNKQHLAAIRPHGDALAMSTMRFADEVVAPADLDVIPDAPDAPSARELDLATQIINALAGSWDPEQYHDTYTDEMKDLIMRKSEGEVILVDDSAPAPESNVIDLMAALEASVQAAKEARSRPEADDAAASDPDTNGDDEDAETKPASGAKRPKKQTRASAATAPTKRVTTSAPAPPDEDAETGGRGTSTGGARAKPKASAAKTRTTKARATRAKPATKGGAGRRSA